MWWAISCLVVMVGRHASPWIGVPTIWLGFWVFVAHLLIHAWFAFRRSFPILSWYIIFHWFLLILFSYSFGLEKNQRLWKVFGIGQSRIAEVHLKAGDLFYLPIFWWHAVQGSIGRNMILNWWCQQHPYKEHLPWCPPWLIHQTVLGQWTSTKLWCLKKVAEILGLELQDT